MRILATLFGCPHSRTTFPLTPIKVKRPTYVVCLDCGKEFDYDWAALKIGRAQTPKLPVRDGSGQSAGRELAEVER